MDINEQKQQFSFAYVRAVASVAGFTVTEPSVDDDSIDLQLGQRGGNGTIKSPKLDIQVKASSELRIIKGKISFPLPQKNYDELIPDSYLVPRILVIVRLPGHIEKWIKQSGTQLVLLRCGYWLSLCGLPATANTKSTTVHIPTKQIFSVEVLRGLMEKVGRGQKP